MEGGMPCYAGLPKYVVLKSKHYGKYMHYLWNEEFAEHYKQMGCKRDLDITNPFVKLEVVPSTTNPSSFVHLRCSYNNKFLKLVSYDGRLWVSATADSPDEEQIYDTSTLFQPVFRFDEPKTVALKHVQSLQYVGVDSLGVANMYSESYLDICCRFEFAYWESYEEKMNAKDLEIVMLKGEVAAKDGEICKLKKEVDAKDDEIQCRGKQIAKLQEQMTAKDDEIVMLKGEVAAKEGETRKLKEEIDAKEKEIAELKERMAANGKEILQLKDQLVTWESKCQEEMQKLKNIVESLIGSHT